MIGKNVVYLASRKDDLEKLGRRRHQSRMHEHEVKSLQGSDQVSRMPQRQYCAA